MVTVAPLTGGSHPAPFGISLRFEDRDGRILLDRMRTLDRRRLVRRLGQVEDAVLRLTLTRLREFFAE